MIRAECEKCGKVVNVPDSYAGGEGKCKRCGWRVYIPQPGQGPPSLPKINPADTSGPDALAAIAYATDAPAGGSTGEPMRQRRPRRKKSNTGVLVAAWMIAVALLVLIGVAIYAAKWHQSEWENPTNPEIRYVDPNK